MHRLGINSDFTLRRHDCAQRDRPLDGAGFISARFRHRPREQAHGEIGRLRVGRYDRTIRKPVLIGFDEPVVLRRVERGEIDARRDVTIDRRGSDRRELDRKSVV